MIKNLSKLFFWFLFGHLVIWTLIPSFVNNNLPLDTIEALAWVVIWNGDLINIHPSVLSQSRYFIKSLEIKIGPTIS